MLEYYDGVLFLTTNRVGTVDEGFRSRIHLSLYYPILGKKQTLEIFKLNIQRIKEIERSMADLRGTGADGQPSLSPTEIDEGSILDFATRHWENTRKTLSRRVSPFCPRLLRCYKDNTDALASGTAGRSGTAFRLLTLLSTWSKSTYYHPVTMMTTMTTMLITAMILRPKRLNPQARTPGSLLLRQLPVHSSKCQSSGSLTARNSR